MPVQAAAPPPEDLLDHYIFTTYHLLLKEIRNEAGDTEIVALRVIHDNINNNMTPLIGLLSQQ